jgi:hypothetical protein
MTEIRVISISGSKPTTNQLALGDIALNTYDGKAFIKKVVNNSGSIVELGTGGGGSSISASYALTASYAENGGVTQLIAGTNVTLSPTSGKGAVTINAVLASSGSGTPNGPLYSLQFNNGGLFSGSGNFTLLNNADLYLTGSLRVSGSITSSLFGTASWASNASNAITASYILNAVSSSFASTASFVALAQTASYITLAQSASYVLNAVSSSFTVSSSYSTYAVNALMAVIANTASYVLNAVSSSFSTTASYAFNAVSASFATTASYYRTFPYTGSALITGSLGVTGSVSITKSGSTVFSVEGSSGQLFSVTDSLSGSLFSVNTVAGLPVIEAFSDNTVNIGKYGAYGLIVNGSTVRATGSFTGSFTGSLFGTASWASNAVTASYALSALSASFARTASFINPLTQSVFISGSTTVKGDFTVNSATTVDLNTNVLNVNAPLITVPTFALPYSPSVNIRTVMYDATSNALFVTSSLPGTGGGGGFANYIATGSITASVQIGPAATIPYFFMVQSGSAEMLKINAERVVVLESRTDIPTAVTGGIYYSASGDFFFGM